MIRMASVEQALDLIVRYGRERALGLETVVLAAAEGRRLAEAVVAQVSQPPADVSAMDGYAVRFTDMPHRDAQTFNNAREATRRRRTI